MEETTTIDARWMKRSLELAVRGRGCVEPNPLVGAVIARGAELIAEGWHQQYGGPHAEVNALAAAGDAARGATLYVTLEPCCHVGKTPPCTDAVLRAGIGRVVVAMLDPFPAVSGRGARLLREAGVHVMTGIQEAEARRLNAPYLTLLNKGRPYVHAKWAMTLDGKIATRTGDARWISNEASRRLVHELRGKRDAVIIGHGTAVRDNPLLTARPPGPRTPLRIVLSHDASLPADSRLVTTARAVALLVVCRSGVPEERLNDLRNRGCEILAMPPAAPEEEVSALLAELGRRRFTNVLVEGGGAALGSFLDARVIDEVHVFIARRLVGGKEAPAPMLGTGVARIADALPLSRWDWEDVAGDLLIHGTMETSERSG